MRSSCRIKVIVKERPIAYKELFYIPLFIQPANAFEKTIIAKKNVPHIYVKDKNYRCVWDSLVKKLMKMIIS